MKKPLLFALLLALSLGCSGTVKRFFPGFQVTIESEGAVQASAGRDMIAVQAKGSMRVSIDVQEKEGTKPVEQWSAELAPGDSWYREIEWGPSGGGWIEVTPVSCERARAVYPGLVCPEPNPAGFHAPLVGKPERKPMYVGIGPAQGPR